MITGMMFLGLVTAISQQQLDDADIADAIESECRFDHAIDVNRIDVAVLNGIAELTGKRLQRGEISELESTTAQIDALNARACGGALTAGRRHRAESLSEIDGVTVCPGAACCRCG